MTSAPAVRRADDRGSDALGGVLAAIARIEARLACIEARFGVRDQADADLLVAVRDASIRLVFTVRAIWLRRQRDAALSDAILAADIDSARQFGKLLARLAGADIQGLTVTRGKDTRDGVLWQITRV